MKILQELNVHVLDHLTLMGPSVSFAIMEPHGIISPSLALVQATDYGMERLVVQIHVHKDLTR